MARCSDPASAEITIISPRAGTGVVHDSSVVHGVAPMISGRRFSLLLFYRSFKDMFTCMSDETKEWVEALGECFCIEGYEPDFTAEVVDHHYPCIPLQTF